MKIDAILFDLDGTLWDVVDSTYEATRQITNKYHLNEVSKKTIIEGMGKTKEECAKLYYPNLESEKGIELIIEGQQINNGLLIKNGGNLYDGLQKTLGELKKDYKLCIVSNCTDGYIEAFLTSSQLEEYFDDFMAAGKFNMTKAIAIKEVIKRNSIKRAIYVGDTSSDREAARDAGILFVHAKYGFERNLVHQYKIESISDLPKLVKSIVE